MSTPLNGSIQFILDRAEATRAAQASVAGKWVWDEKTLAAWDAQIEAVVGPKPPLPANAAPGQRRRAADAEAAMLAARGTLDQRLDALHALTVQGVGLARVKFRNDRDKVSLVEHLSARGDSRRDVEDEATDWLASWEKLDPAFVPVTGNDRPTFAGLLDGVPDLRKAFKSANADFRREANRLNALVAQLEDDAQAWYAAATQVFPEATPEGKLIRGTVPTTYSPPPPAAPAAPAPSTPPAPTP